MTVLMRAISCSTLTLLPGTSTSDADIGMERRSKFCRVNPALIWLALCALLAPTAQVLGHEPSQDEWTLVWADEFDIGGAPSPDRWTFEEGYVRNDELQYYTDDVAHAVVEDGELVIRTSYDPGAEHEITSASLTTAGRAAWQYGRVEVRARIPGEKGAWPAIWMLPTDHSDETWPLSGEIDIMEHVALFPGKIGGHVQTQAFNHVIGMPKGKIVEVPRLHEDFHVYAIEWNCKAIHFEVDGERYYSYENSGAGIAEWPFDKPYYLILNTAFGGKLGAAVGLDVEAMPIEHRIDWVRVFKATGGRDSPSG